MNLICESRFFETICYAERMNQYEKAISWINAKAETLPGKKADLMRLVGANKPTFYRALKSRSEGGVPTSAETFFKWLDALGFQLVAPDEKQTAREVCFVDAKVVPAGEGLPKPEHEDYYAVPLVDDVGAGGGQVLEGQLKSWFLVWKHQAAVRNKTDMIAVRLANTATSMQPTLWPGDIVLVHLGEKTVDYPGKIWLVKDPDNEGKIKRVSIKHLPQEKDDQITYYSDNAAEYPPEVYSLNRHFLGKWNNAIIGRVLWGWTDLTRK